jgi:hypothetical protein|tara:strand:+ start:2925 stop:3365 length:441 start_codon:yes stop_codon:yes gene_type:complete
MKKENIKECCIILDGVDKTGKDSIKDEIIRQTDGKALVISRSFLSQIVYSRIYNRKINEKFFIEKMKELYEDKDYYFFYLEAEKSVLEKRFIKHNEKDLLINDIQKHIDTFEDVILQLEEHNMFIKKINSTNYSVEESVKEILKKI